MSTETANVKVRVEPDLKNEVERLLSQQGYTSTQAINMFYAEIKLRGGLPFDAHTPNTETLAAFEEDSAGAGRVFHGSTEEAFETILKS